MRFCSKVAPSIGTEPFPPSWPPPPRREAIGDGPVALWPQDEYVGSPPSWGPNSDAGYPLYCTSDKIDPQHQAIGDGPVELWSQYEYEFPPTQL